MGVTTHQSRNLRHYASHEVTSIYLKTLQWNNAPITGTGAKGGGRSGLVGEWTAKFPRSQGGGDLSLSKMHTFRSCGSPILILGFVTGGECRGLYHQCFPSRWGIVIFKVANPHLQPVPMVVGHLSIYIKLKSRPSVTPITLLGLPVSTHQVSNT